MADERVPLSDADAVSMLPDGERIHTFRSGSHVLVGADWPRAELIAAIEAAARIAHHELTTLHGLTASDGLGEYGSALREGLDANAAWKCFVSETWRIDVSATLAALDAALLSADD